MRLFNTWFMMIFFFLSALCVYLRVLCGSMNYGLTTKNTKVNTKFTKDFPHIPLLWNSPDIIGTSCVIENF